MQVVRMYILKDSLGMHLVFDGTSVYTWMNRTEAIIINIVTYLMMPFFSFWTFSIHPWCFSKSLILKLKLVPVAAIPPFLWMLTADSANLGDLCYVVKVFSDILKPILFYI